MMMWMSGDDVDDHDDDVDDNDMMWMTLMC